MHFKKGTLNKEIMPPIITICVMVFIICTAGIARVNIHNNKESRPTLSTNIISFEEKGLNNSEKAVLSMLYNGMELPEHQQNQETNTYSVYYKGLKDYLNSAGVDLSITKSEEVKEKIKEIIEIENLEKNTDFSKLSIDSRGVVLVIMEQIYKLCGLKLVVNMEGVIEVISDQNGNLIYQVNRLLPKAEIQVYALIITLLTIILLMGIYIIIVKKNQLFKKEVMHDGFDEERFA